MSQTFKKNAIAVGVTALLASGVASSAFANQFEASTVDTITKVNLLADNATIRTVTATINEQGTWTNGASKLTITLPSTVKYAGATAITGTSGSPTDIIGDVGVGFAASVSTVAATAATGYVDASGNTVIVVTTATTGDTTPNEDTLALSLKVKAPIGAATGDVSITIADGDTAGLSKLNITNTTIVPVAIVSAPISASVATPASVVNGTSLQAGGALVLKANQAYADTTLETKTIDIVLNNGAKFAAAPTVTRTTGFAGVAAPAAVLVDSTTARITFAAGGGADAAIDDKLTLDGNYLDLTSATAGAITATISSSGATAITNFATQTVTVANSAVRGTTVAYVDTDGNAKKPTLFYGRTAANAVPLDGLTITEAAFGSLTAGGTITLALSNGAKFVTGQAPTATITGASLSSLTSTLNTAKTSATFTVSGASTTAGKVTIALPQVDLSEVTAGNALTVTVAGTAGASGTADIATLSNSVTASIAGALPVITAGGTATLPDLVITEATPGALAANGTFAIVLPTGITLGDVTGVTTTQTGGVTGVAVTAETINGTANGGAIVTLTSTTSTTATGAGVVTIKGLVIKAAAATATNAPATGDVSIQVAGSAAAGGLSGAGDTADVTKFGGNVGAFVNKQSLKVATLPSTTSAVIPTATVTGAVTSQTIAGTATANANDQGKPGTVYVAAIIGGSVFFRDAAGAWSLYDATKAVPYYATTTLATFNYNVISATDLTAIVGAQIVVGYGIGLPGLGNPFKDMIDNAKYGVVYTVAK